MEGDSSCPFDVWILGDNGEVNERFQTLLGRLNQQIRTRLMTRSEFEEQLKDFKSSTVRVVIAVPYEERQIFLKPEEKAKSFHKEVQQIIDKGNKDDDLGMVHSQTIYACMDFSC